MNYRLPLTLVLLAGCSGTVDIGLSDSDSTQTTTQTTGGAATSDPSAATTGDLPTTSATEGPQTATEQGGSGGVSQTGGTTEDIPGTGTSGPDETSTSTTTDTTGEPGTSTGGCVPKLGGPAPVVLGDDDDLAAAGAYAVLAKTAVTSVPGTSIAGHVGISPAAASDITGFALILHPSGEYATSKQVVDPGKIYAADYTVPTPTNLTTAVLGMQAAYVDAAGRIPTDYLDLESGDIGGLTLEPGIYTWGSTVLVPVDVTIAGCEDDVWIFQIAGDLDVSTAKNVILAGGAQAKNVFWQVAGQATIHANAHFEGIILSKTGITFQTKASLHGRALAQTMVAFDKNAVTTP